MNEDMFSATKPMQPIIHKQIKMSRAMREINNVKFMVPLAKKVIFHLTSI